MKKELLKPMRAISRLHCLTQDVEGFSHAKLAELACLGGADWVQLRVKNKPLEEWLKIAEEAKQVCRKSGARLIINDNVYIAKKIEADGVHLGKKDMGPAEARKILGGSFIIGGTANDLSDIEYLVKNKVDYIGLGPFRFTSTKEDLSPVLGSEGISRIIATARIPVPVIAIGGIEAADVDLLMKTGIYGIAVSSAINFSADKKGMTKKFLQLLQLHSKNVTR